MEKFWDKLSKGSEPDEVRHRIYNLLYLDREGETIEEIRADFDNWTIEQLEGALEHIYRHFTLEESLEIEELAFGESGVYVHSDFFEAANQRDGVSFIWKNAAPQLKTKKFF